MRGLDWLDAEHAIEIAPGVRAAVLAWGTFQLPDGGTGDGVRIAVWSGASGEE